ncbi:MAG: hypothetical protein JNL54_09985 [Kineosporiaceae bacterium]|nr:hypothetical protein [Kineosporiaceae bacterium]
MVTDSSTGVALPVVAASLMGAGAVLSFGLIRGSEPPADPPVAAPEAPVALASTAPAPITLTRHPALTATAGGSAGVGQAAVAADPVRHRRVGDRARVKAPARTAPAPAPAAAPRATGSAPTEPPPVTVGASRPVVAATPARTAPAPVTLVLQRGSNGHLYPVQVIDPAADPQPIAEAPDTGAAAPAAAGEPTAPAPTATPQTAWRRGAVGQATDTATAGGSSGGASADTSGG